MENVIEITLLSLLVQALFFPEKSGNVDVFWRPQDKGKIISIPLYQIHRIFFRSMSAEEYQSIQFDFFPIPFFFKSYIVKCILVFSLLEC